MCVLLYFGTEYQNTRSFEIILQIHLLICYLLDFIIYLFIELTLFVSYTFMFVNAGLRFVPNKPEMKKEVIIIRPFGGKTPRSNLFIRFQRSQQTSRKRTIFK